MTTLQMALNRAGVFASGLKGDLIETARREMERALFAARLRDVRRKVTSYCAPLTVEETELAVRHLCARRTSARRGNRLVLPGERGWAQAGRRG